MSQDSQVKATDTSHNEFSIRKMYNIDETLFTLYTQVHITTLLLNVY